MILFSAKPHDSYKLLYIILKDDEEWRTVHQGIVPASMLQWPVTCASDQEWYAMWSALELKGAKAFALRRLTKKSYSSFELDKILKQHFVGGNTISILLQEFKEKQLVDDSYWVEGFVKKEIRQKLSPKMIFAKLKTKGVPSEIIHNCLKKYYSEETKRGVLQILIEKDALKDKKKMVAKLARKGFQIEDILAAIRDLEKKVT